MTSNHDPPVSTNHDKVNGLDNMADANAEPLAIVGMACRFAGEATSPEKLWELVSKGRDAWSPVPAERFTQSSFYHPQSDRRSTMPIKGGFFIQQDPGLFDSSFFNFTAEVAAGMDPQIRMQLEIVFEALESAGIPMQSIVGSNTAVYTGSFTKDYHDLQLRDTMSTSRAFVTGNYAAMLANRISHFFDLKGPSVAVDTGCSTSLMGVHMATQSLRLGEADCAIVGGCSLHLNPDAFSNLSTLQTCGPDGKCYTFDARAQGYGRGDGVAAIVMKRLSTAIRDGDVIRAVVRESASNQDGRTSTITAPSSDAQRELIKACYERAGLNPRDTSMVEAHGTGTRVGDPAEARAIGQAIGKKRKRPLYVASVKTNLGHTEAASGLAAVIKMVLALEHEQIPPSLNFETANPEIDLVDLGLKVPTKLEPWISEGPRRVSINNFGYGGTNTHVIMEEAPRHLSLSRGLSLQPPRQVILLSARHKEGVETMRTNLRDLLQSSGSRFSDPSAFAGLAYTLAERRTLFPWTIALSASGREDLASLLEDSPVPSKRPDGQQRLGFVFNGQGAQWYAMGKELATSYPVYQEALDQCDRLIQSFGSDWSINQELSRDEKTSRVNEVKYSMPLTCAVQLALVQLLDSFGVRPTAVTGHSSGEIAAAFAAGALSLKESMAAAYFRGLVTWQNLVANAPATAGGMMAVSLGAEDAQRYIDSQGSARVIVACQNSPSSVTLSGDLDAIEELEETLTKDKVFARKLVVQCAFHSHHMQPLEKPYLAALKQHMTNKRVFKDDVLFVSPVTGQSVESADQLGPKHWVQNMMQPVLFASSFRNMVVTEDSQGQMTQNIDMIVEIGPHSALAGPIRQILKTVVPPIPTAYETCLSRGVDAVSTIQTLACSLVKNAYPVDISRVNTPNGSQGLRVVPGLPTYPWDHTHRFWHEPRMSTEHRYRLNPHHDLLGVRLPGTSDLSPIWRQIIRANDLPWVRDHVVQGDAVYPAAGYITMAIEAMSQLHSAGPTTEGYLLEEVEFLRAVVVPEDDDGVETQLFLEPPSEKSLESSRRIFHIYAALEEGGWAEVSRGAISVETSPRVTGSTQLGGAAKSALSSEVFYDMLHELGIKHTRTFQGLTNIHQGQDISKATVVISDVANVMPYKWQQPHVIHPVTLDTMFQSAYTTLSPVSRKTVGTAVPRSIQSLYISSSINHEPGVGIDVRSELLRHSRQGFDISLSAQSSKPSGASVVKLEAMRFQSIGQVEVEADDGQARVCAFEDWVPSVQLNEVNELFKDSLKRQADPDKVAHGLDLTRAAFYIIDDVMRALTKDDIAQLEWYHKSLYRWMQLQLQLASEGKLGPRSANWSRATPGARASLVDRVAGTSVNGELTVRVGRNLLAILRKEVAPLEIMLEGGLLHKFYKDMLHFTESTEQLAQIAKAIAREKPRARILEIGAGTGGCTGPVLDALGGDGETLALFEHYTFTDISSGFFQSARSRFAAWGDLITYQSLNIENDPVEQGFEEKFDLIIAAQVLHATKDMSLTMRNVRNLLKDDGKLLLVETTHDMVDGHLIFGTLPGWWLSKEPDRKYSPNMSLETWKPILENAGFSGIDFNVWDCEDESHQAMSVIMSSAVPEQQPTHPDKVALVYSATQPPPTKWLTGLAKKMKPLVGSGPIIRTVDSADIEGRICVFLSGLGENPHIFESNNFEVLKNLAMKSRGILWVTSGSSINCEFPVNALHKGFLRTCRVEDQGRLFISLDLDPTKDTWDTESHESIVAIFRRVFGTTTDEIPHEFEYAERNGQILVPRLVRDADQNSRFLNRAGETEQLPFVQPQSDGRVLRLEVTKPGSLDSIVFVDDEDAPQPLKEGWVEVEPHAYGLNFRDVMSAMGQLDEKQELGVESAGIITRIGSNTKCPYRVGMRVVALTPHGHIAARVRVPWHNIVAIPDTMEFAEAASISAVFATAYYSMFTSGQLEKGDSILVHAAAGGVGQACIILAQWKGITVFATVSSQEKRDFLKDTYGLTDSQIFSSRDDSFVPGILAATNNQGVDVVINSLAGHLLNATWHIVAQHGRFIEIGKKDIHQNKALEMRPFRKAVTFSAVDLVQLCDTRGEVVQRLLVTIMGLLKSKTVRNISPITVFSMSNIARAFRTMQAGKHIGKIVIVPQEDDMVKVVRPRMVASLNPNATYLVIGGLGGIGRICAKWLVEHGAKQLLLLSRRAASSPHSAALSEELQAAGARVLIKNCNAADINSLRSVLNGCSRAMAPVRGIVHGGMMLDDSILERMTTAQWSNALAAKVSATRNLETLFPRKTDLDFLVILSSGLGVIGSASQANYTSGGTFQDAIARRRASLGLPCTTIDLGMVDTAGYVAEHTGGVAERLLNAGHKPLAAQDVLHLLDYCVRHPIRTPLSAQVVSGLSSTAVKQSSSWGKEPRFAALLDDGTAGRSFADDQASGSINTSIRLKENLRGARTEEEAGHVIEKAVVVKLAEMFVKPENEFDVSKPLSVYGVDSLVAVELRNWLVPRTQCEMSIFDLLGASSLTTLSLSIAKRVKF